MGTPSAAAKALTRAFKAGATSIYTWVRFARIRVALGMALGTVACVPCACACASMVDTGIEEYMSVDLHVRALTHEYYTIMEVNWFMILDFAGVLAVSWAALRL